MKKIIIAAACLTLFALNIAAQGAGRMEWFKDANPHNIIIGVMRTTGSDWLRKQARST